jgi:pyruvate/2-oxoglutarate dehydrogenase complex dihydrolipoamide acyltransferase (E2) component
MRIILKLARVGMNMQEATIAKWFKEAGQSFCKGDTLYSIETDKVTQDVGATHRGTLVEIFVLAGQNVDVGHPVCIVDVDL